MANKDTHLTLLPKLGAAIDTALATWEAYLSTLTDQPTYDTIVSSGSQDATTKSTALKHVLEALPARHTALTHSYNDTEAELVVLSDQCAMLLEGLHSPDAEAMELEHWFQRIVNSKRFIKAVADIEKELAAEEQARLQALTRLKACHVGLMEVRKDGELGRKEVETLVEAMEEVGVSLVGSEVDDGVFDEIDSRGIVV